MLIIVLLQRDTSPASTEVPTSEEATEDADIVVAEYHSDEEKADEIKR